ncbi:type I-B CRISPR-associated protein Cas7/Cst2/DevR [bacterium]|nr:type I-B CRISPR-associated protein Cas7/Cst2/DevR [bacterium]
MKAVSLVWLSKTGLTNLNSGEGGSQLIDIKRYRWQGKEYPYVSGQAMRFYLKEAIRREVPSSSVCTPNDIGETCRDVRNCILCDLFGYMGVIRREAGKRGGADIRLSPVKVSPAMGLLPYDENAVVDFLTRRHRLQEGQLEGDIVNVELAVNIYKAGVCVDLLRLGRIEELKRGEDDINRIEFKEVVPEEERKQRLSLLLSAIADFSDYSKQARLLTDFTPDILLAAAQNNYSHRLQKALSLENDCKLNLTVLQQIIREVKKESLKIFAGLLDGVITNGDEVKELLKEEGVELLDTPREALESLKNFIL